MLTPASRISCVLATLVALLALLAASARSGESPRATASPSGPLRVERATHVANPLTFGGEVARAELHGEVVVRNVGPRAVSQVKLTVRHLEEVRDYPLGTLAPGQGATVEWSMTRIGPDPTVVEIDLQGSVDGRRTGLKTQSREVVPPNPNGTPGGPPPGY